MRWHGEFFAPLLGAISGGAILRVSRRGARFLVAPPQGFQRLHAKHTAANSGCRLTHVAARSWPGGFMRSSVESGPNGDSLVTDPHDVYAAESESIRQRRRRAWSRAGKGSRNHWAPQSPNGDDDYVGLALSGGGIRSASVGLGALQALCRSGLIRSIDYLSTVSGGGYIGGFFSSAAVSRRVGSEQIFNDSQLGEPNCVKRLIYGGKYLYRPWEAANKYLIGLLLINLSICAGMVALGAALALIWRSLDAVIVRDFLDLFRLNSDILAAFLPFYVFFALWFGSWMLSNFRHEAEAPGRWAQRWLYFAVAALLIGFAVLLANGEEIKLGFLSIFVNSGEKAKLDSGISKWVLGLLAAALIPLLRPSKLIQMGTHPQGLKDRVVFRVATFAFLVGIPVAIVGFISMRDISNTARDPFDNLRVGDVRDWPAFCGLFGESKRADARSQAFDTAQANPSIKELAGDQLKLELASVKKGLGERSELYQRLEPYTGCWSRLSLLLPHDNAAGNPLFDAWHNQRRLERDESSLCDSLNSRVLTSRQFPNALVQTMRWSTTKTPSEKDFSNKVADQEPDYAHDPAVFCQVIEDEIPSNAEWKNDEGFKETIASAKLSYAGWNVAAVKEFNLYLLRKLYPELFYTEGKAYRWIVVAGDQWWRLKCFTGAFLLLLLGLFVDMNRTSLHRFYRNRLEHAYIVPPTKTRTDISLSDLRTTELGAPYHIINATVELSHPRFLDEVDKECREPSLDRRDRQSFIFSQQYCGSTATGWMRTRDYEAYLKENISLSDAMALSGAALDPMPTGSLPITVLMTVLNLGLGQWMPNPSLGRPKDRPSAWQIYRDWRRPIEASSYCFVGDGGFSDNSGITSLLKRRCRVIIAVDASCDGHQEFTDLGVALRTARIQEGIRIVDPRHSDREIDTKDFYQNKERYCARHYVVGRILYPEHGVPDGWLVYLKPSFTGDEGTALLDYRLQEPGFPHDTTADQFYDYAKFESYRQLGYHIIDSFCRDLAATTSAEPIDILLTKLTQQDGEKTAKIVPLSEAATFDELQREIEELIGDLADEDDESVLSGKRPTKAAMKAYQKRIDGLYQLIRTEFEAERLSRRDCSILRIMLTKAEENLAFLHKPHGDGAGVERRS
jgi:hypothetical protein